MAGSLKFVTAYVDTAANNTAYVAMKALVPNRRTDTGHAEGFAAAQMIVRAFQFGPQDVDAMAAALEGYQFGGLKTGLTIRPRDHLLLEPLWGGRLIWTGAAGVVTAVTERLFAPTDTAVTL
jgi:branched-chain amino acid transport system substrate-binding protein